MSPAERDARLVGGLLALVRKRQAEIEADRTRDPADLDQTPSTPDTSYLEVRHPNGSHR